MRIQSLYDLQQEINRLFMAGSKFAPGDPRLSRLAPVFDKLGEKVLVFKKIAADIRELVSSDARSSGGKLMELAGLLCSILYTQGEALEKGVEERNQDPLLGLDEVQTRHSYSQLLAVREMVTAKSGRLESMEHALEHGLFSDFRAFPALDLALDDKYSELSEYVVDKVIPQAGKGAAPFLLQNFRYEDKTVQIKRLNALINLDIPELPGIVREIFRSSLPRLQVAAVRYLQKDRGNEEFLVQLAADKKKELREAAFEALAATGSEKGLALLIGRLRKNRNKSAYAVYANFAAKYGGLLFLNEFLAMIKEAHESLATLGTDSPAEDFIKALEHFLASMTLLNNKNSPEVHELLSAVATDRKLHRLVAELGRKHRNSPESTPHRNYWDNMDEKIPSGIAALLLQQDEESALRFYEKHCRDGLAANVPVFWDNYHMLAFGRYSKEETYAVFAPAVEKGNLGLYKLAMRFELLSPQRTDLMDDRWRPFLHVWLERNTAWTKEHPHCLRLLHALEPADNARFGEFLLKLQIPGGLPDIAAERLAMLVERRAPGCFDEVYAYCAAHHDALDYHFWRQQNMWRSIPREYWLRLNELNKKSPNHYLSRMLREMLEPEALESAVP